MRRLVSHTNRHIFQNRERQNYEIPVGVDLCVCDTVVWCARFSSPFTAADLA